MTSGIVCEFHTSGSPERLLFCVRVPVRYQRHLLTKSLLANVASRIQELLLICQIVKQTNSPKRPVALVLDFFVSCQRREVIEDDIALFAFVAMFMLDVKVTSQLLSR